MPEEPRGFFERLTGARLMSGSRDEVDEEIEYEDEQPEIISEDTEAEVEIPSSDEDISEVMEEPEVEQDDIYSDEAPAQSEGEEQEGQLTVDVFQDDQSIIIQSTIAGVSPEDLDVSITNDMVTIRGERRQNYEVDQEDYFYQECYWGTFSRSIILPVEIDADRAEAKIKNGILSIRIPKANAAMTRKLKVKAS